MIVTQTMMVMKEMGRHGWTGRLFFSSLTQRNLVTDQMQNMRKKGLGLTLRCLRWFKKKKHRKISRGNRVSTWDFFPFYFQCLIDTHRQVFKCQLNKVKAQGRTLTGDNDLGNFNIQSLEPRGMGDVAQDKFVG